jgi:hypothetical protein
VLDGDFSMGGGGRVLPIPQWMTPRSTVLPSEDEIAPWFDAVCAVWDDAALYHAIASRAQNIAADRYSETVSRRKHVDYFTSLTPCANPIVRHP